MNEGLNSIRYAHIFVWCVSSTQLAIPEHAVGGLGAGVTDIGAGVAKPGIVSSDTNTVVSYSRCATADM